MWEEGGFSNVEDELELDDTRNNGDKFMGKKEKRRSSFGKEFVGDGLNAAVKANVVHLMAKYGDQRIVFSDHILKVNKRGKTQKRIMLLTDSAVYNLEPGSWKCKRRISLMALKSLSLSPFADNFLVLHVPTEYDYCYISHRKTEICTQLIGLYAGKKGEVLLVDFDRTIRFRPAESTSCELVFSNSLGGVNTEMRLV